MSDKLIAAGVSVLIGIIGVAVLATLVSGSSDTSKVITAGAGGFGCVLKTALTGVNQCPQQTSVTSGITFGGIPTGGRSLF